ncbi:MAG: hypothetical protein Ta2G_19390 [Termitinemataceae bacterium]|nr:MAG: hypothetical protein Ta2G_19390 [Termitinemataceae bacterium]
MSQLRSVGYPILFILLISFIMCSSGTKSSHFISEYYIDGTKKERENLTELFKLLEKQKESNAERFALVREIANVYNRQNDYGHLINFLSYWIENNSLDPYNTYYLFMIAYSYIKQETYSVAVLYFNLIVKNYSDLIVNNESIHLLCLKQLIEYEENAGQKIWYYEELISRFRERIDLGVSYFLLAKCYEQIGDWNKAIAAYSDFLPYYGSVIPGFPDAYSYAKQMVDFYHSSKDWTFNSLSTLVDRIERAIDNGNTWQLWQYRAKINFFARSWAQADSDDSGMADLNLSSFGSANKIHYSESLGNDSNANEAYLRTWGWSHFTPIWYFYFRKVYFPLDPEIHGRWEWAGVYYGEEF